MPRRIVWQGQNLSGNRFRVVQVGTRIVAEKADGMDAMGEWRWTETGGLEFTSVLSDAIKEMASAENYRETIQHVIGWLKATIPSDSPERRALVFTPALAKEWIAHLELILAGR